MMVLQDQLPWSPSVILLPLKVAESESPSSTLVMPRVTPLPNTAKLAVGAVFHMSSPSLATEFSPKAGAVRQHQQLAPALTSLNLNSSIPLQSSHGQCWLWWGLSFWGPWEQRRHRLHHGCEWRQHQPGWWWVWLRKWLVGKHCQLHSWVSNLGQLPHMVNTKDAAVKSAQKIVLQEGVGLLWSCHTGPLEGHSAGTDKE